MPVNDDEAIMKYCKEVKAKLEKNNVRVSLDERNEKLSYKIREAQTKKIPYTLVIGLKEATAKDLTYRLYGHMDSKTVKENEFLKIVTKDISTKAFKREY
jgi:threonyl-tRNA synthetase